MTFWDYWYYHALYHFVGGVVAIVLVGLLWVCFYLWEMYKDKRKTRTKNK